jgi:hypothetical protein
MTEPDELDLGEFDDFDAEILTGLRRLHTRLDAPPPAMAEQMIATIALLGIDAELASLAEDALVGSGARATERTRSISFEAASLTIMVTAVELADGRVRLDGWLAPAGPLRVELRLPQATGGRSSLTTTADETGRFVFAAVPRGLVSLVVHRDDSSGSGGSGEGTHGSYGADDSDRDGSIVITPTVSL